MIIIAMVESRISCKLLIALPDVHLYSRRAFSSVIKSTALVSSSLART